MDQVPEEDKLLCEHVWKDLYGSEGVDKDDPNVALIAFYCEKCLIIKVKSYPQHRYYKRREWLEEFEENKQGEDNGQSEMV